MNFFKKNFLMQKNEITYYKFIFSNEIKDVEFFKIDWTQSYTVKWFIYDDYEDGFVVDKSILIHPNLFLLLRNEKVQHLVLFSDVLIIFENKVAKIQSCNGIKKIEIVKSKTNSESIVNMVNMKKELKKINRNSASGLLPEEIFRKYELISKIKIEGFFINHSLTKKNNDQ